MNYLHKIITLLFTVFVIVACNSNNNEKKTDTKIANNDKLAELNFEISRNPKNLKAFLNRAEYYLEIDKANEALNDVSNAMKINDKDASVYSVLADVYYELGKIQRAFDALTKAISLEPNNANLDVKMAKFCLTMKDYNKTFTYLRSAINKNKEVPEAYFFGALANLEIGDTNTAIENFKLSIKYNPDYYEALKELGYIYYIKHNTLAIDYLRAAANINSKKPDPLYILGLYYQENGKEDYALKVYDEIIGIDSVFIYAYYNKGYVYLVHKKEYEKAIDMFNKVLSIDNKYIDAIYNRGYSYELMKKYANARNDYERVLKERTNDEQAINGLNRIDKLTQSDK